MVRVLAGDSQEEGYLRVCFARCVEKGMSGAGRSSEVN